MPFTAGRKAIGLCDVCGVQWKLNKLRYLTYAGRQTRVRVCPDCYDTDQPQLRPDKWLARGEAIAVRDPRPDPAQDTIRSLSGFGPVVGVQVNVEPAADGWSMIETANAAETFFLLEAGSGRVLTETGNLLILE